MTAVAEDERGGQGDDAGDHDEVPRSGSRHPGRRPALGSRSRPASDSSARCDRRRIARATRSSPSSSRRATRRSWRPRSSTRPTPWAVTAARTSGASAIRSTRRWASSLARSWVHRLSNCSLSSARARACSTAGCPERPGQRLLELGSLQDPDEGALHGGALGRPHDRLLDRRLGGAIQAGRGRRPGARRARRFRSGAPEAVSGAGSLTTSRHPTGWARSARRARLPSRAQRWPPRPAAGSEPADRQRPSCRRGPRGSRSRPGCPGSRRARRPAARPG